MPINFIFFRLLLCIPEAADMSYSHLLTKAKAVTASKRLFATTFWLWCNSNVHLIASGTLLLSNRRVMSQIFHLSQI